MKNLKLSISAIVFLLVSSGLFAQTNFAGTWAFNESKSNFGDSQFRFAATTMVVTQDAKVLAVESTMPGRDGGEMKTSAKYNFDGTVSENPGFMNSTSKSTVAWSADKTSLTIFTTMNFERDGETREFKSSAVWKLAEGGKVMMIENTRPGPDGEMKTTAAYDKK
jgi:hypothetical protein